MTATPGNGERSGQTAVRKGDHIDINLHRDVQARETTTGFERVRFVHAALPEVDLADISSETQFLGKSLAAPILISGMTGGIERGLEITRTLARVAQEWRVPIGVGSQRAALESSDRARFFQVRDVAPDVLLLANLGAIQLNRGLGVDDCRRAVDMIGADALVLHLNPLQEALQAEGDREFGGLLLRIAAVARGLEVPLIVKEIGCGISAEVARKLADAGVAAIDVGGAGGTSWSGVEHHRADSALFRRLSETFFDWGIPTMTSLQMVRQAAPERPAIASGGMRTGLDAAKAVALGATLAGFAAPMLKAAVEGEDAAHALMQVLIEEVRLAMFCTASPTLDALRQAPMMFADGQLLPGRAAASMRPGQKGAILHAI